MTMKKVDMDMDKVDVDDGTGGKLQTVWEMLVLVTVVVGADIAVRMEMGVKQWKVQMLIVMLSFQEEHLTMIPI